MTLQKWANGIGMHGVTVGEKGDARYIVDTREIEHSRTWLWDLEDYIVSSVSGGTIWLIPRVVHPFLYIQNSDYYGVTPVCGTCGQLEAASVHVADRRSA